MSEYSYTTISTSTVERHIMTDDEHVLLGQVIDIDGEDAVILGREDVRNASGRVSGQHWVIRDTAWEAVQAHLNDVGLGDSDDEDEKA